MIFPTENQKVKASVQSFISAKRIPHAILIEGENSADNISLADFLAAAAVCDSQNAPCGSCINCHQATVKTHPDIAYIAPLDGKKNISVDQIRELRADAYVKPHSAKHKVYIITEARRMNPQAQNALLKVLEEPPANVIFILLVPSKTLLLDTIISRCVLLSLITESGDENPFIDVADEFLDLLFTGSEYDMLKLLSPLEKSRTDAEDFFKTLALCAAKRIKNGSAHARVLDRLFDNTKYYLDLLTTNVNMSLLISLAVSQSKGLLDNV